MTTITSFKVSPKKYFVTCNADTRKGASDAKLTFDINFTKAADGDDAWIEKALADMRACLNASTQTDDKAGK